MHNSIGNNNSSYSFQVSEQQQKVNRITLRVISQSQVNQNNVSQFTAQK